jgi:hypothetical protein
VHAEEFSCLPDRDVSLALLCALCASLSHGPMLAPSEASRKPSGDIQAPSNALQAGTVSLKGQTRLPSEASPLNASRFTLR